MPKFNVHLLTSTSIWEGIEAEDEEEALEEVPNALAIGNAVKSHIALLRRK